MFKGGNNKIEFETCMIKLCNPKLTADIGAMLTRIEKLERVVRSGGAVQTVSAISENASSVNNAANTEGRSHSPKSDSGNSKANILASIKI